MRKTSVLLALALAASLLFVGCSKLNNKSGSVKEADIYVEYDGGKITKADFDERVKSLPEQQKESLNMAGAQVEFLTLLAKEQAFYLKAIELGYDKAPEVTKLIDSKLKQHYLNAYYDKKIRSKSQITDQDIKDYYDDNQDLFLDPPTASIKYIQTKDMETANKALAELAKGVDYPAVANVRSINQFAQNKGGFIEDIRNNGYIPGVGNDTELDSLIFSLPLVKDKYYGPFETKTGIHIFSIFTRQEAKQKEFDLVKDDVKSKAKPARERELNNARMDKFIKSKKIVTNTENLNKVDFMKTENNEAILEEVILTSKIDEFDWTVKDLLEKFNTISKQEKMFISQNPSDEVLEHVLSKEMYYFQLKQEGFDKELNETPKFKNSIKTFILSHTYKMLVADAVDVSDEEMLEYYNENKASFSKPAYRKVEVLSFGSKKKADQAHSKYLAAVSKGSISKIESVMKKYALNKFDNRISDKTFRNGIVPNFGRDSILSEGIWNLPVNEVSDVTPIKKDNRYAIYRTLEETPIKYTPFNHVEPQIEGKLVRAKAKAKFEESIEQFMKDYNFVIHEDKIRPSADAAELFELAERQAKLGKYKDTVLYYQQIINNFKNGKDDYKAKFMIAFTQSEYIKDKDAAIKSFEEFLVDFPEGELNDDATFMLKDLKGEITLELPDDE